MINLRVISFLLIALSPLWAGLVAIFVVMIEQKLGLVREDE